MSETATRTDLPAAES